LFDNRSAVFRVNRVVGIVKRSWEPKPTMDELPVRLLSR
jgi:hypothetical protein